MRRTLDWLVDQPALPTAAAMGASVVVVVLAVQGSLLPVLLVLLLAAPVIAVVLHRPQVGVLLLVAGAPFDGLRVIAPQVNAGWKFALLGLVVAGTFVCPPEARRRPGGRPPDALVPVLGLLGLGLVSALRVGPIEAIVGLKVAFAYLFVWLAVWRCPLDRRDRDRLVSILMVTGLITSVYGIAQQAIGSTPLHERFGYPYDDVIRFADGDFFRSFSTFDQSANFGLFLMLVLLLCTPVALADRARTRNTLFLYTLPVIGVALLSTFARTALVGLAVGFLVLGVRRYHVLLGGLALAVAGLIAFAGPLAEPIGSSSSLGDRASGWSENLDQVRANPIGAGIGVTGSAAETVNSLTGGTQEDRYQPDNYYFKTLYELGLLGLWLLALFYASALRVARRAATRSADHDGFYDGVAAATLAAVIGSFFTSYLEIFPMDLFFWLFVGLASNHVSREPLPAAVADPVAAEVG